MFEVQCNLVAGEWETRRAVFEKCNLLDVVDLIAIDVCAKLDSLNAPPKHPDMRQGTRFLLGLEHRQAVLNNVRSEDIASSGGLDGLFGLLQGKSLAEGQGELSHAGALV